MFNTSNNYLVLNRTLSRHAYIIKSFCSKRISVLTEYRQKSKLNDKIFHILVAEEVQQLKSRIYELHVEVEEKGKVSTQMFLFFGN